MLDFAINYKNFFKVDDIVLKDNKIISLLHNTEYYDVELVLTSEGKDY